MIRLKLGRIRQDAQVTQQSVSQAGMVGESLMQVGQQIAKTGEKLGSIVERRRAEEARDQMVQINTQNQIDDAELTFQLEDRAKTDPDGIAQEYDDITTKRHEKILSSVEDERARERLKVKLDAERQINTIKLRTFENKKKADNYYLNEQTSNMVQSQAFYERPVGSQELNLAVAERLVSLDERDMDPQRKLKLQMSAKSALVEGNIRGIMKGESLKDFAHARSIVENLPEDGIPIDKDKLIKQINNQRAYTLNNKARDEKLRSTEIENQYEREKYRVKDLFQEVVDDPNADVRHDLEKLKFANKFNMESFNITPKSKMSPEQIESSEDLLFETLESLAETTDPVTMKDTIYRQVLSGAMSAEDGVEAMNSLEVMSDSKIMREEMSLAKKQMKASMRKSFSFSNKDKLEKVEMEKKLTRLVRKGISPSFASRIVIKDYDLKNKAKRKVYGYGGDLNNKKELQIYAMKIKNQIQEDEIDSDRGRLILKQVLSRMDYLNSKSDTDVPSYEEAMERK